tara:strand:- start:7 stop:267 length:261 start_codon:yes stop_codon:yes gene_type:complete
MELTPFEQSLQNLKFFAEHAALVSTIQFAVEDLIINDPKEAYNHLNWRNDPEEREVLKGVMKYSKELKEALVKAADTLEENMGISA